MGDKLSRSINKVKPKAVLEEESELRDARMRGGGNVHLAIKIDFEGESRGVKNRAAIVTAAQMELHFTGNVGSQTSFEVFANQANCRFARHTHHGTLELGLMPWIMHG